MRNRGLRLYEMFHAIDKSGDGLLQRNELHDVRSQIFSFLLDFLLPVAAPDYLSKGLIFDILTLLLDVPAEAIVSTLVLLTCDRVQALVDICFPPPPLRAQLARKRRCEKMEAEAVVQRERQALEQVMLQRMQRAEVGTPRFDFDAASWI